MKLVTEADKAFLLAMRLANHKDLRPGATILRLPEEARAALCGLRSDSPFIEHASLYAIMSADRDQCLNQLLDSSRIVPVRSTIRPE